MSFPNGEGARLATIAAAVAALFALTLRGPLAELTWTSAQAAFWLIVVVTAGCAVAAVVLVAVGWRRRLAELAILGSALFAASVFPMVHGLTIPGVLYPANAATMVAAFAAVPLAVLVAGPLVAPRHGWSVAIARRWRAWTVATMLAALAAASALLVDPGLVPAPRPGQAVAWAALGLSLAGMLILAIRHFRLYRIGRRRASLVAAVGLAYLGLSALVYLVEQPFSVGWWAAHLIDALGVLGAAIGLAVAYRRERSLVATMAPVVNRDPLIALELGLTSLVHRFVGALERKDPITRDHVVRVGERSMRCGVRAGLHGSRLRALGLGALLHDVGKLFTPDRILTKPGPLTDSEYETIKDHSAQGAALMRASPLLAPAADLVRWHHERADGRGYPDGLRAGELPVEVGIVSACDGWDAMTSLRSYRDPISAPRAREILRQEAGKQWTAAAVELVLAGGRCRGGGRAVSL